MADSLTDLYLGGSSSDDATEKKPDKKASLIDTYLSPTNNAAVQTTDNQTSTINDGSRVPIPQVSLQQTSEGLPFYGPDPGKSSEFMERTVRPLMNLPSKVVQSASELPTDYAGATADAYKSGVNQLTQGVKQIGDNAPAIGTGNMAMGALSAVTAPVSGAIKTLIENPVTNLTGNPDIGERAGMVAGFGLPVKPIAKTISNAVPTTNALNILTDAIGQENLPSVIQKMKNNPRLSVMDVSPAVQQMGQKLVTTEGDHQNKFVSYVKDRADTAKNAVQSAYDETMGAPVNVVDKINEMKTNAQATGKKLIEPVVQKSPPADVTSVVNSLDNAISNSGPVGAATLKALKNGGEPPLPLSETQNKLFQIRQQLRGDWTDKPQMLLDIKGEQGAHNIQKTLRAEAQTLLDSPVGSDKLLGGKIMGVRNQLVDAIDKAAPGYKNGLSAYADDMQIQEAFHKGQDILKNRPTNIEDRPEYLKQWLQTAKPEEIQSLKEGARTAIDNQIRGMRFAAKKGTDIPEIDFNADKLKQLFGEKETNNMFEKLRDAKLEADTNSKLIQNSQTAMRMKSDSRVDVPLKTRLGEGIGLPIALEAGSEYLTGTPGLGAAAYYGAAGMKKLGNIAAIKLAKARNNSLTDLMTAKGNAREKLLNALTNRVEGPKQSLLARTSQFALPVLPP